MICLVIHILLLCGSCIHGIKCGSKPHACIYLFYAGCIDGVYDACPHCLTSFYTTITPATLKDNVVSI